MPPLVAFRNVSYEAGSKRILQDLSLELSTGETLVLLGRSGSGKTTALKLVNGMLFPTFGEVIVEGRSTREWNLIELRRRIGYVIQDVGLFPHFTVARNVGLVPSLIGWETPKTEARVAELLLEVGLPAEEYASRYPRSLSGGQRQRVGIARALAANPDLLLFDEPFGALDPVTRHEVQQQFLRVRRLFSKTALFVTHDVQEALGIATRVGLLHGGNLVFLGNPDEFLRAGHEEARAFLSCLEGVH